MGTYPTAIGGQHMRTADRNYDMVPPADVKAFTEGLRASGYYCSNNAKTDYQMGGPAGSPPFGTETLDEATFERLAAVMIDLARRD